MNLTVYQLNCFVHRFWTLQIHTPHVMVIIPPEIAIVKTLSEFFPVF